MGPGREGMEAAEGGGEQAQRSGGGRSPACAKCLGVGMWGREGDGRRGCCSLSLDGVPLEGCAERAPF